MLAFATLKAGPAVAVSPALLGYPVVEERQIREVLSQQIGAWNNHDADRWAAAFAHDADFTSSLGTTTHGQDAIKSLHVTLFAGPLRRSSLKGVALDVRVLDHLAVVQGRYVIDGNGFATTYAPTDGTYRSLMIMRKDGAGWTIAAMQWVRLAGP